MDDVLFAEYVDFGVGTNYDQMLRGKQRYRDW